MLIHLIRMCCQVNPPFMIHSTAVEDQLMKILEDAGNRYALSFVLVYPTAHYTESDVRRHSVYSKYMQFELELKTAEHWYVQHALYVYSRISFLCRC